MSVASRVGRLASFASRTTFDTSIHRGNPQKANGRGAKSYAELRRRVIAAGLLDSSYGYYALLASVLAAGLVGVAALLVFLPGWGDVVAVALLALVMVQFGFLVHDAGHMQIFRSVRNNRIVGLICAPMLLGVSFEAWVDKHNAHHAHVNEVDDDPDINHPLIAFTPEQAAERTGWTRWLVRYQGRLYFVLAMFATIGFRADAWMHVIRGRGRASTRIELACIIVNHIVWLIIPSVLLGPGRWLPVFFITQLIVGVYMVSVFAPNHKGMPFIRGRRPTFLEQQVLTARNVNAGPIGDLFYGGLNYQIEHHLFPNVARNRMPELRQIVKPFCHEVGLSYEENDPITAYRLLIWQLEAIGRGEDPGPLPKMGESTV